MTDKIIALTCSSAFSAKDCLAVNDRSGKPDVFDESDQIGISEDGQFRADPEAAKKFLDEMGIRQIRAGTKITSLQQYVNGIRQMENLPLFLSILGFSSPKKTGILDNLVYGIKTAREGARDPKLLLDRGKIQEIVRKAYRRHWAAAVSLFDTSRQRNFIGFMGGAGPESKLAQNLLSTSVLMNQGRSLEQVIASLGEISRLFGQEPGKAYRAFLEAGLQALDRHLTDGDGQACSDVLFYLSVLSKKIKIDLKPLLKKRDYGKSVREIAYQEASKGNAETAALWVRVAAKLPADSEENIASWQEKITKLSYERENERLLQETFSHALALSETIGESEPDISVAIDQAFRSSNKDLERQAELSPQPLVFALRRILRIRENIRRIMGNNSLLLRDPSCIQQQLGPLAAIDPMASFLLIGQYELPSKKAAEPFSPLRHTAEALDEFLGLEPGWEKKDTFGEQIKHEGAENLAEAFSRLPAREKAKLRAALGNKNLQAIFALVEPNDSKKTAEEMLHRAQEEALRPDFEKNPLAARLVSLLLKLASLGTEVPDETWDRIREKADKAVSSLSHAKRPDESSWRTLRQLCIRKGGKDPMIERLEAQRGEVIIRMFGFE